MQTMIKYVNEMWDVYVSKGCVYVFKKMSWYHYSYEFHGNMRFLIIDHQQSTVFKMHCFRMNQSNQLSIIVSSPVTRDFIDKKRSFFNSIFRTFFFERWSADEKTDLEKKQIRKLWFMIDHLNASKRRFCCCDVKLFC